MGCIYISTNKLTKKSYIGYSCIGIIERKKSHLTKAKCGIGNDFYKAIREYGEENFEWSLLEKCSNEEVKNREIYYIKKHDTYKNGYNMTEGGDGSGRHTEITKQKISDSLKEFF